MLISLTQAEAIRIWGLIDLKVTHGSATPTDIAMWSPFGRSIIYTMPASITPDQRDRALELLQEQADLGVVTPEDVSVSAKLLHAK